MERSRVERINRMKKWANKRRVIELENTLYYMQHPRDWKFIKTHQKKIKRLVGARY